MACIMMRTERRETTAGSDLVLPSALPARRAPDLVGMACRLDNLWTICGGLRKTSRVVVGAVGFFGDVEGMGDRYKRR